MRIVILLLACLYLCACAPKTASVSSMGGAAASPAVAAPSVDTDLGPCCAAPGQGGVEPPKAEDTPLERTVKGIGKGVFAVTLLVLSVLAYIPGSL
ncbi:hypothetical protein [Pseudodesulfovibrio indicus]|uniref:hypothetical protein n=1 Tax=Pseudodesulfovibrio indicus TaxID=1716143 RepID=UPI002930D0A1|nr:hypothetical protein [Pseudodesulfovibrio indicus]